MKFTSREQFLNWPNKAITIIGMSGVGKTTLSNLLRTRQWFTYNVDYRIGTRYMGEHIVDNFKREAMKVPLLRDLLRSDSIYISSNITFENLAPLSTYLGKPGNPAKGGLSFDEYKIRQARHRKAEIAALKDIPQFIQRAHDIYGYDHFFCDTGGSVCEVIDFDNQDDEVLQTLRDNTLVVYIKGTADHARMLTDRFASDPKPMYYLPSFLDSSWENYKQQNAISDDDKVDPDDFAIWGFEQLLHDRMPRYEAIINATEGITIAMDDIPDIKTADDFLTLIADTISNS